MFTGIVQAVATIQSINNQEGIRTFTIEFPDGFCEGLEIGASVAIDGVCLTVTALTSPVRATFDVMQQSLTVTTLDSLRVGSRVNAERAAKDGAEIGGHPLSGHIDFCATVSAIQQQQENYCIRFSVPEPWMRYIFTRGYIALNGTSLTVSDTDKQAGWFEVWLIPETRRMTTFEDKLAGSQVNVEIERSTQVMVDTVRAAVAEQLGPMLPALRGVLQEQGIEL